MDLDDDLRQEVNSSLSGKKRLNVERGDVQFDEARLKGETLSA